MSSEERTPSATEDHARVLTKALRGTADQVGLTQRQLAAILGISEASASRLRSGRRIPYPSKEAELALLLIRLYRSLDALVGGDQAKARAWLGAGNVHLNGIPRERIQTVEGLVDVVQYLDGMRGKL